MVSKDREPRGNHEQPRTPRRREGAEQRYFPPQNPVTIVSFAETKEPEVATERVVTRGGVIGLNARTREFTREGHEPKILSRTQVSFMEKIIAEQGKAVSPTELYLAYHPITAFQGTIPPLEGKLRDLVKRLRKKIGDDVHNPQIIKTYQGRGYGLALPPDAAFPQEVTLSCQAFAEEISLNTSTGEIRRGAGEPVDLQVFEQKIVEPMMRKPGLPVSVHDLYLACHPDTEIDPKTPQLVSEIRTYIDKLRKKLTDTNPDHPIIYTHTGAGYSFGIPQEEQDL